MGSIFGSDDDSAISSTTDGSQQSILRGMLGELEELNGGATDITYLTAAVNLAAATANQVLVANAVAGKGVYVYGLHISSAGAGSIAFQDEDDTVLSGIIPVGTNGGFIWPIAPANAPWLVVADAKALEADTLGASATMDGIIIYAIR